MTRDTIPGRLDPQALARLSRPEIEHRPADAAALARECARLVGDGLSIADVAAALRVTPRAVADLLALPNEGN